MTRKDTSRYALMVVAWAFPGVGHLLLGRKARAAVFAAVVFMAFVTGLALNGELVVPFHGDPMSYLKAFACLGSGALYVGGRLLGYGHGDPTAVGYAFGKAFIYTSGLMNWLLVLDVSDIAKGKKRW